MHLVLTYIHNYTERIYGTDVVISLLLKETVTEGTFSMIIRVFGDNYNLELTLLLIFPQLYNRDCYDDR